MKLLFFLVITVTSLLFPPLLLAWLLFLGAWTRWDERRQRQEAR